MNNKSTTVNYNVGMRSGKEILTFTLCVLAKQLVQCSHADIFHQRRMDVCLRFLEF